MVKKHWWPVYKSKGTQDQIMSLQITSASVIFQIVLQKQTSILYLQHPICFDMILP